VKSLPGALPAGFRQHENLIQDVGGNFIDVHKYSYTPGFAVTAQIDLGHPIVTEF